MTSRTARTSKFSAAQQELRRRRRGGPRPIGPQEARRPHAPADAAATAPGRPERATPRAEPLAKAAVPKRAGRQATRGVTVMIAVLGLVGYFVWVCVEMASHINGGGSILIEVFAVGFVGVVVGGIGAGGLGAARRRVRGTRRG